MRSNGLWALVIQLGVVMETRFQSTPLLNPAKDVHSASSRTSRETNDDEASPAPVEAGRSE
jgi:hypothetical protein